MLISILANLVMDAGVTPPVRHTVPDSYIEDKGGSGDGGTHDKQKFIYQDDEEILFSIIQWIAQNS